jgi:hypothetical protein
MVVSVDSIEIPVAGGGCHEEQDTTTAALPAGAGKGYLQIHLTIES